MFESYYKLASKAAPCRKNKAGNESTKKSVNSNHFGSEGRDKHDSQDQRENAFARFDLMPKRRSE